MNNSTLAQIHGCTFADEGKNPRQQTRLQHDIMIGSFGNTEIRNSDGPITEVCKIEMLKRSALFLPSLH